MKGASLQFGLTHTLCLPSAIPIPASNKVCGCNWRGERCNKCNVVDVLRLRAVSGTLQDKLRYTLYS